MDVIHVNVDRRDTAYRDTLCRRLEEGNILIVDQCAFAPSDEDSEFLRAQRQTQSGSHKNIAYKPNQDRVTGVDREAIQNAERTRSILAKYSRDTIAFLTDLFPAYAAKWRVDYASFRPVEEQGRNLPVRHRNDLMHLDAFPTRPTHGGRILRLFTNIHPTRDRVWGTADSFEDIAAKYAVSAGLLQTVRWPAILRRSCLRLGKGLGLKLPQRSAYDDFMLRFHHYLKSDSAFQANGQRQMTSFPPRASWITFTDQVAHRALSGQYALEQTCIVPLDAMLQPELAPVSVLEKLAGVRLIDPKRASPAAGDSADRVTA